MITCRQSVDNECHFGAPICIFVCEMNIIIGCNLGAGTVLVPFSKYPDLITVSSSICSCLVNKATHLLDIQFFLTYKAFKLAFQKVTCLLFTIFMYVLGAGIIYMYGQIAKFMGPTWGPPGSCRPQLGPMLAP